MLEHPNCFLRNCAHFTGFGFDEPQVSSDTEASERPVCKAFPGGIPSRISYGPDLHLVPVEGDGGIIFQEGGG